ncbi:MAG: hypothetical protein GWP91_05380 [Rhodobacterales bacterium]|nr:hypothetical protein [Rhodobacterales bacterium]
MSDISFCHDVLGPYFWEIFPEDTYLDLEVSPTMMGLGSGLSLSVNNRSARTLHNATLVLALHYTDMYPNDYEALAAESTVPAVAAGDTTNFGSVEIATEVDGLATTVDDIVDHRAILVTDEAVVWVDTTEFKTSESDEFREHRKQRVALGKEAPAHPSVERHPEFTPTADSLVQAALTSASLQVESRYGSDDVLVELPKELAILRPLFQLRYNGELYEATDNVIAGDAIQLRFAGVSNFDEGEAGEVELLLSSPFGDVVLGWTPGDDLTWRFIGRKLD